MSKLLIEITPGPLLDRIQRIAEKQQSTPEQAALRMLETYLSEPPLPADISMTSEIIAPFVLPRPEGSLVPRSQISFVDDYVPEPHDIDVPMAGN